MLLRAQTVLPITSDPIHNGAVLVRDGLIADVASAELLQARYPEEEVRDFGQAAIIPGLIDLHTHLEGSSRRSIVKDLPYTEWVSSMAELGSKMDAQDRKSSAVVGGLDALSGGVTCIADVTSTGASAYALNRLGLRGVVYREVGAMDKKRVDFAIESAESDIEAWQAGVDASMITVGVSPRETYNCHPYVFTKAAELARVKKIPLALNLAGSYEEYQFIGRGASTLSVANGKEKRGFVEVPPWLPTGVTPVRYVLNWGAFEADNVMAVHCVHVNDDDINHLKRYDVSVALCSRCNAQLSMGVAPLFDFMRSGLRVGLGTGFSVAADSTDMFSEMRIGMLVQRSVNPARFLPAETMLRMATIEAARALRMDDKIGSLEVGKCADLAVIDLSKTYAAPGEDPSTLIVNNSTDVDVMLTMVGGQVKYDKDNWHIDEDLATDIARVIEVRSKLRK